MKNPIVAMKSRHGLRSLVAGLGLSVVLTGAASAQTPVKFSLDWKFEGPAAPFMVAMDRGYFKAEGLDVTIDTGTGLARTAQPRGVRHL